MDACRIHATLTKSAEDWLHEWQKLTEIPDLDRVIARWRLARAHMQNIAPVAQLLLEELAGAEGPCLQQQRSGEFLALVRRLQNEKAMAHRTMVFFLPPLARARAIIKYFTSDSFTHTVSHSHSTASMDFTVSWRFQ